MKQRIKIIFCIDQLNIGGTEKQLLAVIERLDRTLFEPYLVCLRPSDYFNQCTINCKKQVLEVSSLFSIDGIVKLFRFSNYLRKEKINIVQTFFFDSTVFAVLAAKLARVDKIISCRRDMGFWYTSKLLKILRVINAMTDRVLVNSLAIKENVVKKEGVPSAKVDTLYNGIDLEPFSVQHDILALRTELGIPTEDKIVGIVANLNRQVKRVDLFIEVAAEVLQKEKAVSFIIVGEGHLRPQLEQQASELGIFNKVTFVGSQSNVIPFLQLCDMGVLTSESEGFANSILEYMSAGLPVVCFDSGGNKELVENDRNGYLVKVYDQCELMNKIIKIVRNNDLRLEISKINSLKVQSFSWEKVREYMDEYYCSLSFGKSKI